MRWLAVVVAASVVAAGCGDADDPPVVDSVRIGLDPPADTAARAPLSLSADAGYGGVALVIRSEGPAARVEGRVDPAASRVTLVDGRSGRSTPARTGPDGRFTATLDRLEPGSNPFIVYAASERRLRGAQNVLAVRSGRSVAPPESVTVPERDRTPPVAIMRLRAPSVAEPERTVTAFTGTQSLKDRPVVVSGTRLVGVGEMRDADGGALRVRVTVTADLFCRLRSGAVQRERKLWRRPEAAIERLVVPPGRVLPTVLRRRVSIDLVGSSCRQGTVERVDGQIEADATNATELEEATPIYFSARP